MAKVETILTAVGYNLNRIIDANSEPTEDECIKWINQTLDWILQVCAEMGSEIGRTTSTITCAKSAVTAITAANPGSVTSAAHGFETDEVITHGAIVGMTELNNVEVTVTVADDNTYTIGIDTSDYTAYSSGGYGYKAVYDDLASTLYAVAVMVDDSGDNFSGWIQKSTGRNKLTLVTEAELLEHVPGATNEPDRFFLDGSNNIVLVPTPDDAYTIKIPYYAASTINATTDTVPFHGIFDSLVTESISTKYLYRTREDANIEWNWFKFIRERTKRIVKQRMRTSVRVF